MSDTANSFGGQAYQSQTTKALSSISESPGPDLSDGEQQFVSMLSRHDYQIKFLADNQQTLQVGVNKATSNPIQQIQQFIADLQVLISGAALPKGALDFGDLQYIMPAIGALFGFGTGEYPINLFSAAEKFFFGYVVPTQQYTDLQIAGFNSWASQLGIDPKFIKDMDAMTQAFGDLFNGLQNLGPSLASLFDALGVSGNDLGPIGQFIASILKLFKPIDLSKFGSMIEFITDAMDPWINSLTAGINWINALIAAIGAGGDVVNSPLPQVTEPFANLIRLFATLDFTDPQFSTSAGWGQLFQEVFIDLEQFGAGVWSWLTGAPLNAGNLYGQLSPGLFSNIPGTAITDDDTNLLINPAFSGAISVSGSGVWTWDGYCFYPPGDSTPTPGSVVVIADGTRKQLNSNQVTVGPKLQVVPGRVLTYAVQALATHLTATGTPVQMGVETNLGVTILDQTLPLTVASTTPWLNPPTGSNAGVLSGTYLVPQDGSVTWVSMVLVLETTATAGVVRFSNAFELLTGGLIGDLKSDIADLQDDSAASTAAFGTLVTSWDTAITGYTDWSTFIAALETAWDTYSTTESGLTSSAIFTLQNLFNTLLGISPTTGQMSAGYVASSTGAASLNADISAILTPFNSITGFTSTAAWNAAWAGVENLFGINTTALTATTSSSQIGAAKVASTLGGGSASLGADVSSVHTATTAAAAAATTAGTNASIAIASNQATNDAIVTATGGSPVTGSTTTDVTTGLTNIPASNVVGLTAATVVWGATGGGNATAGPASPISTSQSHTIVTGDGTVYAAVGYVINTAGVWSSATTYGGTAMTLVLKQSSGSSGGATLVLEVWKLKAPPSGSQTVVSTITQTGGTSGVGGFLGLRTVSYSATKEIASTGNTGGSTTNPTMSTSSATGRIVMGVFACYRSASTPTYSGYTQTLRGSILTANTKALAVGDVAGSGSVSFGITSSASLDLWCGITVDLSN